MHRNDIYNPLEVDDCDLPGDEDLEDEAAEVEPDYEAMAEAQDERAAERRARADDEFYG